MQYSKALQSEVPRPQRSNKAARFQENKDSWEDVRPFSILSMDAVLHIKWNQPLCANDAHDSPGRVAALKDSSARKPVCMIIVQHNAETPECPPKTNCPVAISEWSSWWWTQMDENYGSAQKRWEENKGGHGWGETQSQQFLKQDSSLWTVTSVYFTEVLKWQKESIKTKEGTRIITAFAMRNKHLCVVHQWDYDFCYKCLPFPLMKSPYQPPKIIKIG